MPTKEIVLLTPEIGAANPNLSPATRFGNLVFVAGQTGRHPITGEVGRDVGEQTRYAIERIKMILATAQVPRHRRRNGEDDGGATHPFGRKI